METNSFSDIPVRLSDYEAEGLLRGEEVLLGEDGVPRTELEHVRRFATARGLELVGGISASAAAGAPTDQHAYEALRDELLARLEKTSDVQAVFLLLHGAMMAEQCDDCEGDILERVRKIVGPGVPVGVVLDPHAHLTDAMISNAHVMAFMKEYPHMDGRERAEEVLAIMGGILDGKFRPAPSVFDCRLVGFFPTQAEPMRSFVDDMISREQDDGVLSISFVHGFPWGDMSDAGAKMLVYTDNDPELGERIARELHQELWQIKDQTMLDLVSIDESLALIKASNGKPVVLSDIADNPGGGAPSDSTFILQALLDADIDNVAIALLDDSEAVRKCHEVGPGACVELAIGGKEGRFSGSPVHLSAKVMATVKNAQMDFLGLTTFPMGDTAWVRVRGIDIVLGSIRQQCYAPTAFSHLGINPKDYAGLIVKSSNHFRASFEAIAGVIAYVDTPGAINFDFANLPYEKLRRSYYPKVPDPFAS